MINFYYNTKLLKRGDLNFEMVYLVRHWWLTAKHNDRCVKKKQTVINKEY